MNAVAFFVKQLATIDLFKVAGGGASKRQGYESKNVATTLEEAYIAEKENKAMVGKDT